jgi:pSer/pThr/pTyr-binding forkhead associated (FHA) protein/LysM repeat protein
MGRHLLSAFLVFIFFTCIVNESYVQETANPTMDIMIVLDNSISMKTSDPGFLTGELVSKLMDGLSGDSRIGFVAFAESSKLSMPLTPIAEKGTIEKVQETLNRINYIGAGTTEQAPKKGSSKKEDRITVKRGDTLWGLAEEHYGDPFKWPIIKRANKIPGENIEVGIVLYIPDKQDNSSTGRIVKKDFTNIPAAIERAVYELKQKGRAGAKKVVILITDGLVNIRDSAKDIERYRWLKNELASSCEEIGVRVFSMVLSDDADFELVQSLSQKTKGGYYRIFKPEDIQLALVDINKSFQEPEIQPKSQQKPIKEIVTIKNESGISPELVLLSAVGITVLIIIAIVFTRKGSKRGQKIPEAYLVDIEGVTGKSKYKIDKAITTIGREKADNIDISVSENTISATHAQIKFRDGNFYITDLNSKNGTYLNNSEDRINDEILIRGGDIITFDQYKFKFMVSGQSERGETDISEAKHSGTQINTVRSGETQKGQGPIREKETTPSDTGTVISKGRKPEETKTDIPEAYLVDLSEATNERMYRISKPITRIGRLSEGDIDISITKNTVSAHHAQIEYRGKSFYLTDLGSRNGTYLNEGRERLTSEVRLRSDDVIYFDQYRFRFVLRDQPLPGRTQLSTSSDRTEVAE